MADQLHELEPEVLIKALRTHPLLSKLVYEHWDVDQTANDEQWVIVLSRYHRDNLLRLLNAIGYPWPHPTDPRPNPWVDEALKPYNTGDWNGEIPCKLRKRGSKDCVVRDGEDHPNRVYGRGPES